MQIQVSEQSSESALGDFGEDCDYEKYYFEKGENVNDYGDGDEYEAKDGDVGEDVDDGVQFE